MFFLLLGFFVWLLLLVLVLLDLILPDEAEELAIPVSNESGVDCLSDPVMIFMEEEE